MFRLSAGLLSLALTACGGSPNEPPTRIAALSPLAQAEPAASRTVRGCGLEPHQCDMAEATPPPQPEGY